MVNHLFSIPPSLTAALLALFLAASAQALPPAIGPDFAGWELVTNDSSIDLASVCSVDADGAVAVVGKPVSFIESTESCENYVLTVEWRWPGKPGNGGILVQISSGPKDRAWPMCYQVQLKHGSAGDILPMAGATFAEPVPTPRGAATPILNHTGTDSEKPVGEWNTATITCKGDTITVAINGVLQNRVTGCSLSSGHVGFQLEGTPFGLRNLGVVQLP